MTVTARIDPKDLARLRQKLMALMGPVGADEIRKANVKSAEDFKAGIRRVLVVGDPEGGNLVNTLQDSRWGHTGRRVTIGGPGQSKYPLHLEAGHRNRDGSHTPGKPFWNPTKAVLVKRIDRRAVRAERAAIKRIMGK